MADAGQAWPADGGHHLGRKLPLLFAKNFTMRGFCEVLKSNAPSSEVIPITVYRFDNGAVCEGQLRSWRPVALADDTCGRVAGGTDPVFTLWEKHGSFSHKKRRCNVPKTIQDKLIARVYGKGRGWVFTPRHFLDLGPRKSIDMALARLRDAGTIRHLARGLYDYPVNHPQLGPLSPKPDAIAQAIAEKDASRLQPSGAYAVNLLGLSQQVPAKIVYLTDSAEKSVAIGKQRIELCRTTPKNMATAGTVSGLVIQAFRYLKKDGVTDQHIDTLRRNLSGTDRDRLWKSRVHAPAWMHPHFDAIRKNED